MYEDSVVNVHKESWGLAVRRETVGAVCWEGEEKAVKELLFGFSFG